MNVGKVMDVLIILLQINLCIASEGEVIYWFKKLKVTIDFNEGIKKTSRLGLSGIKVIRGFSYF